MFSLRYSSRQRKFFITMYLYSLSDSCIAVQQPAQSECFVFLLFGRAASQFVTLKVVVHFLNAHERAQRKSAPERTPHLTS
jgi:hypothetical protein